MYRLTLDYDRNRMAEIQADIAATPYEFTDATWKLQRALERLVLDDADALRIVLRANLHMKPLDRARIPAALRAKIEALDIDRGAVPGERAGPDVQRRPGRSPRTPGVRGSIQRSSSGTSSSRAASPWGSRPATSGR